MKKETGLKRRRTKKEDEKQTKESRVEECGVQESEMSTIVVSKKINK